MSETQSLALFERCGAIIRNSHLVYTSGRHGSEYVNKDALYPNPEIISELCGRIAKRFERENIDVVLAPALGGIILTQWVAHHLTQRTGKNVLAVFAEKVEGGDGFILKRGYQDLVPGKRTLIVEDVLTTGGSVKKVVALASSLGAQVVGVAALCNRGSVQPEQIGAPVLYALAELTLESWPADECPLCEKGVPLNQSLGKAKK